MLPKENRLKNTKDIERVFKEGRGIREDFLFLKTTENNLNVSRFAFIVSRKAAKRAVDRNRVKRRLRSAVQKRIIAVKNGFDVVFIAQKGAEKKALRETEENIDRLLQKTKLLK